MRAETLSRTRIFRTDPTLDAAIARAADDAGVGASSWLRRAIASVVSKPVEPAAPLLPIVRVAPRPAPATAPSLRFLRVPANALPKVWPQVGAWLDCACQRPGCDFTAADLRGICERDQGILVTVIGEEGWPIAAAVTQARKHQSGRLVFWILAAGGSRARDWLPILDAIEIGAAGAGCASIEFMGRPGWARLLNGYATERCEAGLHFSKSLGA